MAIQDAKKIAAAYNLLKEKGIDSVEKLSEVIKESKTALRDTRESVRDTEKKIAGINDTIKYVERVSQYQPIYKEYMKSDKSQAFYEAHRTEIMLYESAKKTLEQKGLRGDSVRLIQLKKELRDLEDRKLDMSIKLDNLQADYNDLLTAKKNVEAIINEGPELEKDKSRSKESEIQ